MANVTVCVPAPLSGGRTARPPFVGVATGGETAVGRVTGAGVALDPPEPRPDPPPDEQAASTNTMTKKMIRIVVSKRQAMPYWRDYGV